MRFTFSLVSDNRGIGGADKCNWDFAVEKGREAADLYHQSVRVTRTDNVGGKRGESRVVEPTK